MQLTIVLPDELGQRVQRLPNPADFVARAVRKALESSAERVSPSKTTSKWAKIVRRVEEDPVHLEGYSQRLKEDIREFRDHFDLSPDRSS